MIAYIGIGSNLNVPIQQVKKAIVNLSMLPKTKIVNLSSFYQSRPVGPCGQPDYINSVVAIETRLSPNTLLKALQAIEIKQGRQRSTIRWEARVIDLDILLYGNEIIITETLSIPHHALKVREFVLYPLAEIAEDLILPTGESVLALKRQCLPKEIKRLIPPVVLGML